MQNPENYDEVFDLLVQTAYLKYQEEKPQHKNELFTMPLTIFKDLQIILAFDISHIIHYDSWKAPLMAFMKNAEADAYMLAQEVFVGPEAASEEEMLSRPRPSEDPNRKDGLAIMMETKDKRILCIYEVKNFELSLLNKQVSETSDTGHTLGGRLFGLLQPE